MAASPEALLARVEALLAAAGKTPVTKEEERRAPHGGTDTTEGEQRIRKHKRGSIRS